MTLCAGENVRVVKAILLSAIVQRRVLKTADSGKTCFAFFVCGIYAKC